MINYYNYIIRFSASFRRAKTIALNHPLAAGANHSDTQRARTRNTRTRESKCIRKSASTRSNKFDISIGACLYAINRVLRIL